MVTDHVTVKKRYVYEVKNIYFPRSCTKTAFLSLFIMYLLSYQLCYWTPILSSNPLPPPRI